MRLCDLKFEKRVTKVCHIYTHPLINLSKISLYTTLCPCVSKLTKVEMYVKRRQTRDKENEVTFLVFALVSYLCFLNLFYKRVFVGVGKLSYLEIY